MAKMDNNVVLRVVLIVLAAFVLFAGVSYYKSNQNVVKAEKFYEDTLQHALPLAQKQPVFASAQVAQVAQAAQPTQPQVSASTAPMFNNTAYLQQPVTSVQPSEELNNSFNRPIDYTSQKVPSDCFPKDRLTASDLLPHDAANTKWSQVNPAGQGDVNGQNYLTAEALVGIDTVGTTLRNASYDLRSEHPNPRGVWPIMNSTIEPDLFRRPLEIGSECSGGN